MSSGLLASLELHKMKIHEAPFGWWFNFKVVFGFCCHGVLPVPAVMLDVPGVAGQFPAVPGLE